jgi:N utilization substance protein B
LECITANLEGALLELTPELETAILDAVDRIAGRMLQVNANELSISLKSKLKRSGIPISDVSIHVRWPAEPENVAEVDRNYAQRSMLNAFESECLAGLPPLLYVKHRKQIRADVKQMFEDISSTVSAEDREAVLEAMGRTLEARWSKTGKTIRKQTADWLHAAGYTARLVSLAKERLKDADTALACLSGGWKLERQVAVDRNILRVAALELLYIPEVPVSATINEAVELAKKYSTAESGKFVNGVLGALAVKVGDKTKAAPEPEDEMIAELGEGILNE